VGGTSSKGFRVVTKILILGITISVLELAAWDLVAQSDPANVVAFDGWGSIVGQLGVVAVLVWYLYYTTSVTFPRMSQQHADQTQKLVDCHDDTIDKLVTKFDATLERNERRMVESFRCNAMQNPPHK
jgi:hypothetical protein